MAANTANLPAIMRLDPRPKYLSIFITALQQAVAYRARTFLTLLANLIWVVMVYYLWRTVYAGNTAIQGFTWTQMRSYILLSYAINMLLSFPSAGRMMARVRTGEVAQDLLLPVNYLYGQFALALGAAVVEGGLSALFTLALGILVFDLLPPVSPAAMALFLISIGLGFLIKFLVAFMTTLLCFWTVNSLGLLWAQGAVIHLFSGTLIPLAFFPGGLRTLAEWLPFQGIVYTPVMIYLGRIQGPALLQALAVQVIWVVVLWVSARLFWARAVRALEIQGG